MQLCMSQTSNRNRQTTREKKSGIYFRWIVFDGRERDYSGVVFFIFGFVVNWKRDAGVYIQIIQTERKRTIKYYRRGEDDDDDDETLREKNKSTKNNFTDVLNCQKIFCFFPIEQFANSAIGLQSIWFFFVFLVVVFFTLKLFVVQRLELFMGDECRTIYKLRWTLCGSCESGR